jgi:hypothetical protein
MARIELRQWNILGKNVYHTYVAFIKDNGELLAELHGDPYLRNTGVFNLSAWDILAGTNQTIVTDWSYKSDDGRFQGQYHAYDLHPEGAAPDHQFTDQQVEGLLNTARAAQEYINISNVEYGIIEDNSNEVSRSLIEAMGLALPSEFYVESAGGGWMTDLQTYYISAPGFQFNGLLPESVRGAKKRALD